MAPGHGGLRRPDNVYRYQKDAQVLGSSAEYFNAIGMVCSLLGLLLKVKHMYTTLYNSHFQFLFCLVYYK